MRSIEKIRSAILRVQDTLKHQRGPRRTGYMEELAELRLELANAQTAVKLTKLERTILERMVKNGGSYGSIKAASAEGRAVERLAAMGFVTLEDDRCKWFALCDRKATTKVKHSILGMVPACKRCAAFATS